MSEPTFRILIVDDEPNIRSGLALALEEEPYAVSTAADATVAWAQFQRTPHQLVITDLKMPGPRSGLDLVRDIRHGWPETLILVITAHGSVETAVEAMRLGAHDYIAKPVDLEMLMHQVQEGVRAPPPARGESAAATAAGRCRRVSGNDRPECRHPRGVRVHPSDRRYRSDRPDPRGKRHGQGACGSGHPQFGPAPHRAVHRLERRSTPRNA